MKKLLTIALLLSLICSAALAELDVKSMTDEELRATIAACAAELNSRNATDKGILLYQGESFSVYQTGDPYLSRTGRVEIPVTIYNDYDQIVWIAPEYCTVNGFTVQGYGIINIVGHSAAIGELDFATEDLKLSDISQVLTVSFRWKVLDEKYRNITTTEERYEYAF